MAEVNRIGTPDWLTDLLGIEIPTDGHSVSIGGGTFTFYDGLLRQRELASARQTQTSGVFGFKWHQRDTFESEQAQTQARAWLLERYGDVSNAPWWSDYGARPLVLDAGCGAAYSALLLLREALPRVRYLGVDISDAVDVAATRLAEAALPGAFIQADLNSIPLPDRAVDVIFSEGVLHHTDSTELALGRLARLLRPGGRFLFYVYRRKGPIREFTDDYIRDRLQSLSPEEAWQALEPLTKLGRALGELRVTVEVPEDVELLEIPAGGIDLQRLFYWHVFKAFYRPDMDLDEMNHLNFDWYAPRNAHRQTLEQVRGWCAKAGLEVEHEHVENAGITIIARRGE